MNRIKTYILGVVIAAGFFVSTPAFAASYNYTCGDWYLDAYISCSSGTLSHVGVNGGFITDSPGAGVPSGVLGGHDATTYYFVYDSTGGGDYYIGFSNQIDHSVVRHVTSPASHEEFSLTTNDNDQAVFIETDNGSFRGSISNFCISDTSFDECTGGGGGGGGGDFSFAGLILSANTEFASTSGFTMAAAVGFVDDNLIKLFIGSGMSVLYNLRYWIVALIIIAAIVYFAFRAMRFTRI